MPPRKQYDTQEVVKTHQDVDQSRVINTVTDLLAPSLGLEGGADQLATTLVQKLRAAYPLQGRLLHVTLPTVLINIGTEQGVTPGMTLHVFNEQQLRLDGKEIGSQPLPVGVIEITRVEPRLAQARVLEQTAAFQEGWKVRESGGE